MLASILLFPWKIRLLLGFFILFVWRLARFLGFLLLLFWRWWRWLFRNWRWGLWLHNHFSLYKQRRHGFGLWVTARLWLRIILLILFWSLMFYLWLLSLCYIIHLFLPFFTPYSFGFTGSCINFSIVCFSSNKFRLTALLRRGIIQHLLFSLYSFVLQRSNVHRWSA